jgi:hypothetical protein
MKAAKRQGDKRLYERLLAVSLLFIALPFLFVSFVPATDLPQHLAQIRLIEEIITNPQQTTYTVNWYGANSLVYGLLGLNWMIFNPVLAGKTTLLEIALAWCVSIFLLARHGRRSAFAAVVASIFIFNASLYWGLINFFIGLPVFTFWYLAVIDSTTVRRRPRWKEFLLISAISFLLFLAHALWLVAAAIILIIADVRHRAPLRRIWHRWLGLAPAAIYSALWFPRFVAAQNVFHKAMGVYWLTSPLERIDPSWIAEYALGGLRGPVGILLYGGVLIWIAGSLATHWKDLRRTIDSNYMIIGILLLLFSLLAPDQYVNTILFAARWLSVGVVFLLLGLPAPRVQKLHSLVASVSILAFFSIVTSVQWARFETTENSGLKASLDAIKDNSRVLGLDFQRTSDILYGRPFFQTFAYAQALHGGRLNFSFAEHHGGIVSYAHIDTTTELTRGLEWFPDRVRFGDLQQFDYALIHGSNDVHREFSSIPVLRPLTTEGTWRAYQCVKDTTAVRQPRRR